MKSALLVSAAIAAVSLAGCATQDTASVTMDYGRAAVAPLQAEDSYYETASGRVTAREALRPAGSAKNVIIFVGDGMGVSTITAGRIYAGQKQGLDGESYQLTMETFPNVALSKTYGNDAQVSDSAPTAVAMMSGVKTNNGVLGLDQRSVPDNCPASAGSDVQTIFEIAEAQGFSTGIISTARITHATPASTYAHTPSRDWESDGQLRGPLAEGCTDIASQLIDWNAGDGFEVVLGGGRSNFLTNDQADPEMPERTGYRTDGRDLVAEWEGKSADHMFVFDQAGFDAVDFGTSAKVLGLFEPSHMNYELDRAGDIAGEPSVAEMTQAAITRLSQDEDGFILLVEGGRVDHGHHAGNAKRALEDTYALDQAVKAALEMVDLSETLIVVTADHSHTLAMAGYAARGNPILGKSATGIGTFAKGSDGKPYTTLGYLNGPGSVCGEDGCVRPDLTDVDTEADDYLQQSLMPMGSETHGGEDVAVFAAGAGSERVGGVMEQNEIFFVMARSLGLVD
ncbi:MAG: alkaline phosphatase [Ponticaulis sp.]|nr:alkaline phosphatase [Ponticaulis sp.]